MKIRYWHSVFRWTGDGEGGQKDDSMIHTTTTVTHGFSLPAFKSASLLLYHLPLKFSIHFNNRNASSSVPLG